MVHNQSRVAVAITTDRVFRLAEEQGDIKGDRQGSLFTIPDFTIEHRSEKQSFSNSLMSLRRHIKPANRWLPES